MIERGDGWELRFGDHRDALADVQCDALITDPPYSARTHANATGTGGHALEFGAFDADKIEEFVSSWSPRTRGFVFAMTDHALIGDYEKSLDGAGRYVFAPVPIITASGPRVLGDGPASWACYGIASRPRSKAWLSSRADVRRAAGLALSLPGYYRAERQRDGIFGGKSLALMIDVVTDYSEPGDLVCDPCAGGGTTLLAAISRGRRAVGCEARREAFDLAVERLRSFERGSVNPNQLTMTDLL